MPGLLRALRLAEVLLTEPDLHQRLRNFLPARDGGDQGLELGERAFHVFLRVQDVGHQKLRALAQRMVRIGHDEVVEAQHGRVEILGP